ncbi:hypothetical protein [Nitrosomonas sp. Nm166]|uniref:hypothetical protein n=1 Tax=Nitrosomonas sp. Nm166 TaxID=1881054 RepID=UPI0008E01FAF|nr:hypothetical protein [Nitrosomonas sp. Nm166]SFD94264.1 hypothetical protein SAMN05428977_100322 [Nitrosomonas sp. Nm166]
MNWKNVQITCWTVFFIIGCFLWGRHLFATETGNVETKETDKSSINRKNIILTVAPFEPVERESPGRFPGDF